MATLFEVVTGVTTLLDTVGLNTYPRPVGSVDSPAVVVTVGPAAAASSMGGDSRDRAVIMDLFLTDGPEGIENLYAYLDADGDKSLIQLFDNDQTLTELLAFTDQLTWDKPDRVTMGASEFLHVEITMNVGLT